MNNTCPNCHGRKFTEKLDLLQAKTVKKVCEKCHGTGSVPMEAVKNGTVFFTQQCIVGYWQELRDGKPIATLHIHVNQMTNEAGLPLFHRVPGKTLLDKPTVKARYFLEIVNMNTKPKHRKCGIMSTLLERAMADPKIEYIESSWDDSTIYGRNFLLNRKFIKKNGKLVYWKPKGEINGPHDDTGSGSLGEDIGTADTPGPEDNS